MQSLRLVILLTAFLAIVVVPASSSKAHKRQDLGFRPVHFAAVGLPLEDTVRNAMTGKAGVFKIDDGNVVGAGTYEIEPDGIDVDLSLKISLDGKGAPVGEGGTGGGRPQGTGGGGAAKPGTCLVPCAQTAPPTQPPQPALCPVPCPQTTVPPSQAPSGGTPGKPGTLPTTGNGPSKGVSSRPTGAGTPRVTPSGIRPTSGQTSPSQSQTFPTPGQTPAPTTVPTSGGAGGTTTPPTSGGGASSFDQEGLNEHNKFRKVHGVPPMILNAEMSRQATAYAEKIARLGTFAHASPQERNNDGENLSMGCDSDGQTAAEAVSNWYNEVCKPGYRFGQSSGSSGTGHFSQVVWKGSTELGIGKADVDQRGMKCTYIVGRYRPAGNLRGSYEDNVPKGSFNSGDYCPGVQTRRGLLQHLSPRSKIHVGKETEHKIL